MLKRLVVLLLVAATVTGIVRAQPSTSEITLSVQVGFDGSFRENVWLPVYARVSNSGDSVDARLMVRPETSNNAVGDTFELPINLPSGSQKSVFLYITARNYASEIRVELIANDGTILAVEPAQVRSLQARDQLHVVITQSSTSSIDLSSIHDAGYNGFQTNWRINNIPDRGAALDAVDTILFSDVDTGTLTSSQIQTITDWIVQGGHLLVTGGTEWQPTAAGLTELLPLRPDNSVTIDNLTPIANWIRYERDQLGQKTVVATGQLSPDGRVLVNGENNIPLVVRRTLGAGTVDYIAVTPSALPLRGWGGLAELWLTLATTSNPQPGWSYGFSDWDRASNAVNILPGVNLLPDIVPLCVFLGLYIGLIGPLNYFVLNRINRREFAWITIPLLIVAFSILSWVFGFNLRGSEVTLSRLTFLQSWPDTERASVREVIGLLSPRRAQYSLAVGENSLFAPVPSSDTQNSFLNGNVQSSIQIEQVDSFRATNFPVDASFIAAFNAETVITKPDISGEATIFTDIISGLQVVRGSVRNNSVLTLNDPVILVRGQALRFAEPLSPGDILPFEITLAGEGPPSPAPLAYAEGTFRSIYQRSYSSFLYDDSQSVRDIMGTPLDNRGNPILRTSVDNATLQELTRRHSFLSSLMNEPYGILTGRGNQVYLAGWSDKALLDLTLDGGTWKSLDTTLHIIQLAVKTELPKGETVITADQFTWFVQDRTSLNDIGPLDMIFNPEDLVEFRFTPLSNAVLKSVDELSILIDRQQIQRRSIPVDLWNWSDERWETLDNAKEGITSVTQPKRFLGPENSVRLRLTAESIGGYPRIQDVSIEQKGTF
ncbi:MAG: hypothetical protein R3E39_04600 [Anaerolineae bacterium]